jgi:adenylate cyclase
MTFRDRSLAVWGLPLITLVLALIVLGADLGGAATRLRGLLFDSFATAAPRPYEDTRSVGHPVRVLEIDAASIERFGPWPWPHGVMAGLINVMKTHGASVVVVVGAFDRPDPTSARNLTALVPPGPSYDAARSALEHLPSPDDALAGALSGVKSVTGFTLGAARPARVLGLKSIVAWSGTRNPFGRVHALDQASGSLAAIEAASGGIGALNLDTDADGKVRRMPLVFLLGDKAVPTIEAEMLRLLEDKPALTLKSDDGKSGLFGGQPGVASVETGRGPLATAPDGSIWLAYAGTNPQRAVSAASLISDKLAPDALRDAIVYIGSPDELADTPLGPRPVAEIHAEAAENLLLGTVLRRPASSGQAELLCLVLFGVGCALFIARFGIGWAAVFVAAIGAGTFYASWRLYLGDHVLFDAASLNGGLLAVWLTGAATRGVEILRQRARLKHAFTDVLPPRVIEHIARRPEPMKLDGETRTITYLVCGVRGASELASSFRGDPTAYTSLLQRVIDPLMSQVMAHSGAIGKMTADGFTAFWNAPLDDPEHAVRACDAATGMMEAIAKANEIITHERRNDGVALSPVEIGIGIATGPAIAGGFRLHGRTAYSVNGDCVVQASAVQQLSAQYGPAIVVAEDTRRAAERGFAFLEVDYITIDGNDDPVKLYAMLGNPVMRASPKFRALATFHDHIFQSMRDRQWQKARELIAQCRKLSGASQKLYDLHLARIAYFEENPPGPDWDGAFRSILK